MARSFASEDTSLDDGPLFPILPHKAIFTRFFVHSWRCQDRRRSAARHRHGGVSLWRRWLLVARHLALGR